jgi:hypothetical protein
VCLHPEVILRDERVVELAEAVFEKYCSQLQYSSLPDFSKACFHHTEPAKKELEKGEDDQPGEEKDKRLLLELLNPDSHRDTSLPPEEMRSLEALLEDMVSAYRDFGAQYSFFTKCMRLFLSPIFPSSIRSRTLRELRGILHLLTLPEESESDAEMSKLLTRFVCGGLPEKDGSTQEPSDLLEAIVMTLLQERSSRPVDGFILNYSVATLARSLAIGLADEMALQASKRRLNQLDVRIAALVCDVGSEFLKGDESKNSLVEATVRFCGSTSLANDDEMAAFDLDEKLNLMAGSLIN